MLKRVITIILPLLLVVLGSSCGLSKAPLTPAPAATLTAMPADPIPSPSPTRQDGASTPVSAAIKFSYRPPSPKLRLPSVLFEDTGAVVYHEGRFHIFYNCQYDWPPSAVNIAYAVSEDGLAWQQVRVDSIIAEDDIPYPVHSILVSTVLVVEDGTWVLYFSAWANGLDYIPPSLIGRATAPAPEGPWTVDPEPVLEPSPTGWDSASVQRPDVIRVGDMYYLYYTGTGPAGTMIGMAASSDGIHWTRYDDPATTDSLYAEGDPLFTLEQNGSQASELRYPRVLNTPDGWLLFYWTDNPDWATKSTFYPPNGFIHLATSPDGVHWVKIQQEPVFAPADISSTTSAIYTPSILFIEDVYYMFVEQEYPSGGNIYTRIVVTTHEGLLFP